MYVFPFCRASRHKKLNASICAVHASRDQILLDGDSGGEDNSQDEEEVFALRGMPEDESEDEDEGMDEDDDIDDVHYAAAAAKDKKKEKGKKGKKSKKDQSSDEDDDDDEEEEEESWGAKKSAYYASNAGEIESDDEEANELEEQEAKRLQAKSRDVMADDDFGLGDVVEGLPEADGCVLCVSHFAVPYAYTRFSIIDEPVQPVVQPLPTDKQALLRHLEKTNPEALALAHDWEDVAYSVIKSKAKIEKYVCLPAYLRRCIHTSLQASKRRAQLAEP